MENKKQKITKELIERLKELQELGDYEAQHIKADYLILEYIGDEEIIKEFSKIPKWYS